MQESYYVGLDVHKRKISYCLMEADGRVVEEGELAARREVLQQWAESLERPWIGALEATLFSEWIYDLLEPYSQELKVAHPAMLKALSAGKHKNDRIDARKITDLLRCDLLVQSYVPPAEIRELRRVLRYRNLMVSQMVQLKNRISGLLMETGVQYNQKRLHGQRYFRQLMSQLQEVPESVVQLLNLSHDSMRSLQQIERDLLRGLCEQPCVGRRVELLMTIPAVGVVTALTWVLEVGEVSRFRAIRHAVSYCGLCSGQKQSAGKDRSSPISKHRNRHLQRVLVEAAKLAPRYSPQLAAVAQTQRQKGNHNRATLAVARKLVAYLMAVDRSGRPFSVASI